MRGGHNYLFSSEHGHDTFARQIMSACAEVDRLGEDRILGTDPAALTSYFCEKYSVDVPTLDIDNLVAEEHERPLQTFDQFRAQMVTVPGVAFDFELPFSGDPQLFKIRPAAHDMNPPVAVIAGNVIRFSVAMREADAAVVKGEVDKLVRSIERYLAWHRELWANFPADLAREVRQRIDLRRERLMKQKSAAAALADYGIKLREKPGDARTYVPPAIKQQIQPKLPPMRPARPPEPTLDDAQYEIILGLLRDAGHSIEQSASRMRELDEEALRDIFLVPLNAHFGSATGEAFNHLGKTDILIRHEGGNLFVAEFKIWGGEKRFLATIDQLLGYLTWRDTKASMVIFNRNAGFTSVLAKIRDCAKTHPNFVRGPVHLDETSDRFEFSLPQDADRHVIISILSFDLG